MGEKWPIKFSLTITTATKIVRDFFFTCRKVEKWDRRLYFPSEGRHAEDFFSPEKSDVFGRYCVQLVMLLSVTWG
jgi:hypothetical protein